MASVGAATDSEPRCRHFASAWASSSAMRARWLRMSAAEAVCGGLAHRVGGNELFQRLGGGQVFVMGGQGLGLASPVFIAAGVAIPDVLGGGAQQAHCLGDGGGGRGHAVALQKLGSGNKNPRLMRACYRSKWL